MMAMLMFSALDVWLLKPSCNDISKEHLYYLAFSVWLTSRKMPLQIVFLF